MAEHMQFWSQFATPPAKALKPIEGGRMKGKTAINDQWRIEVMTEVFGPCGVGWKFTTDAKWTVPGIDGQVFAFVDVTLYVKIGGTWSDGLPGTGGDFLIAKESDKMHCDPDAFKKATTDAIGNAMRRLGVGSAVYWNEWTGKNFREHDMTPAPTAGSTGFGAPSDGTPPPAPIPQPKKFAWGTATSAERKGYVLAKIAEVKRMTDYKAAIEKLHDIASKIKAADFSVQDMDEIAKAITTAEADINAEASGSSR